MSLNTGRFLRTIKYLKTIQIRYRIWYSLRKRFRRLTGFAYPYSLGRTGLSLNFSKRITARPALGNDDCTFSFLNKSGTFNGKINWNFSEYGKLWTYNLNYFDFLNQEDMTEERGVTLIKDFIGQIDNIKDGLESYPISLRGINWITFLCQTNIRDNSIDACLYAQYKILNDNVEYHLLGNHLLENACSLLFGGFYFKDAELLSKARDILTAELYEQILRDGGHFERSVMYQAQMLERLMDCYNLLVNNVSVYDMSELSEQIREAVSRMRGWINNISFSDGSLPLLNDTAKYIGPALAELNEYAKRLGIDTADVSLRESGYRYFRGGDFEIVIDVGDIGPDYIPGHAHSDTLSFVLYFRGKPLIIDPGISTYENNGIRQLERSTCFHNTVMIDDTEQTETWGSFRVGRRAKIIDLVEQGDHLPYIITASHDGYQKMGAIHERRWEIRENEIKIIDKIIGSGNPGGTFYLHFDSMYKSDFRVNRNCVLVGDVEIIFSDFEHLGPGSYSCPDGFNQYITAPEAKVTFYDSLTTLIRGKP